MISNTAIFILASNLGVSSLFSLTVSIVLLAMFILLTRRVFSPDNRERYKQESLIPIEDDTDEEKQLFGQPPLQPRRRGRLDA